MSSEQYNDREPLRHVDGSPIFLTPADRANEAAIATRIAAAWKCELHPFAALCPVDWYATRKDRVVGVLELKTRDVSSTDFETVFLSVRKWLVLRMAGLGLGVPAMYVVAFRDRLLCCNVAEVDTADTMMGGAPQRKHPTPSNIEAMIRVKIAEMTPIESR
jgi:hypothetical protein